MAYGREDAFRQSAMTFAMGMSMMIMGEKMKANPSLPGASLLAEGLSQAGRALGFLSPAPMFYELAKALQR